MIWPILSKIGLPDAIPGHDIFMLRQDHLEGLGPRQDQDVRLAHAPEQALVQ